MSIFPLLAAEAAEASSPLSVEEFESFIQNGPISFGLMIALKYGVAFIGLAFLIRAYITWSRRKAGLLPPAERRLDGPTVPYDALPAFGIVLGFYLLAVVTAAGVVSVYPHLRASLVLGMGLMALALLPPAAMTVRKRQQMRGGLLTAPPRALKQGFVTFSVGTAISLPLAMAAMALLAFLGEEPTVQEPLKRAIDPQQPANLWIVGIYGILVAPVLEECVFRGLLFPAIRKVAGGGSRGFWFSAIIVSLLFAAIHESSFALLPLFGLAMVLAFVFEKTDSLSTVILGHAFFNASSTVPLIVARLEGAL